jgi:hypothetical protein
MLFMSFHNKLINFFSKDQQSVSYIPLMDLQQKCEKGDVYILEICEHSLESCIEQPLFAA